jgi:hypothetical protein
MEVRDQLHALFTLPKGKRGSYLVDRRPTGAYSQSGHDAENIYALYVKCFLSFIYIMFSITLCERKCGYKESW